MTLLEAGTWTGKIFSDGWQKSAGGISSVMEPATGSELGSVGLGSPEDVADAVARAAAAQPGWAATSFEERAAVLRRAGALWEEHAAEVQDWLVREAGSIPPKAEVETHVAAQECYEAAALASHTLGDILPTARPRLSLARRRPVGVVGVIAPFNYPLILSIRSVAPALALGNSVVLKPDPRTAVTGGIALARVFEEAGLPPGVLQVLPGDAVVGEALVEHPRVPVISFTGSSAAGRLVGAACGRLLKRSLLELGGNSALIVLDDADLDLAASAGAFGLVPAPGADLHGDRAAPGARLHRRRLRRAAGGEGGPAAGRQPGHRAGRPRPADRCAAAGQGARPGHVQRLRRRHTGGRRAVRGAVLPADRARGTSRRDPGVRR